MEAFPGAVEMTQEVCENVYLVGSSALTDAGDCMAYLIRLGERAVLVDTGTGRANEELLRNIEATGAAAGAIEAVILTHCHVDHIGGANAIRKRTGARIYAHERDARAIEEVIPRYTVERYYGMKLEPIPVDVKLSGGRGSFDFAPELLQWIHTPGHTPGSISVVYVSPSGEKVLFGQDIHGPFEPGFDSNIDDWQVSMKKLLELEPDILCEGHFGILRPAGEARRFIEQYLRHYA